MSATIKDAVASQRSGGQGVAVIGEKHGNSKNYKGFVAGVFSGIAKLSGKFTMLYLFPEYWMHIEVAMLSIPIYPTLLNRI